jgi:hypothetical protein
LVRFILALSLYEEAEAALRASQTIVPLWSTGGFLETLGLLPAARTVRLHAHAQEIVAENVKTALDTRGVVHFDLVLPPLLRVCIRRARNVSDVVNRALDLREERWVRRYRRFLSELCATQDGTSVARVVLEMELIAKSRLSGWWGALPDGNISVGLGGPSLSASWPMALAKLVAHWHPFAVYNSQLSHLVDDADAVRDLAAISGADVSVIAAWLKRTGGGAVSMPLSVPRSHK